MERDHQPDACHHAGRGDTSINTRNELYLLTIRGLAHIHKCAGGVLWLRRDAQYTAIAPCRMALPDDCAEAADSAFCRRLAEGWIFDHGASHQTGNGSPRIPGWISTVPDLGVVVPLLTGEDLIGFVGLQRSLDPAPRRDTHFDLLRNTARHAATTLGRTMGIEMNRSANFGMPVFGLNNSLSS